MADGCEEDEDVVVPEVRRKVDEGTHMAMGGDMVLLWVCAGCDAALAMVILLHWITGEEVNADLSEDLVKATASMRSIPCSWFWRHAPSVGYSAMLCCSWS
jgi:hypothetical protein